MSRAKETNLIPFPRWCEWEFITKAYQGNDVQNKESAFKLCVGPANLKRKIWINLDAWRNGKQIRQIRQICFSFSYVFFSREAKDFHQMV